MTVVPDKENPGALPLKVGVAVSFSGVPKLPEEYIGVLVLSAVAVIVDVPPDAGSVAGLAEIVIFHEP